MSDPRNARAPRRQRRYEIVLGVVVMLALAAGRAAGAPYPLHTDYPAFYDAFTRQALDPARVWSVERGTIVRGPARFQLESGRIFAAKPVGGRVCVVVFSGIARFGFSAPPGHERDELERLTGADSLARTAETIVFVFADSTLDELTHGAAPAAHTAHAAKSAATNDERKALVDCFRYIGDSDTRYLDPELARAFLEGRVSGHFMAYLPFGESDRMLFEWDPTLREPALLWREAKRHRVGLARLYPLELVCQVGAATRAPAVAHGDSGDSSAAVGSLAVAASDSGAADDAPAEPALQVDRVTIDADFSQEMRFRATATLDVEARADSASWFALELLHYLSVDSVRWDDAPAPAVYKHGAGSQVWVRAERPLARGERRSLRVVYHGPVLDNAGDWLFLRSSWNWHPRPHGGGEARYDVTFRVPDEMRVVGAGRRVDTGVVRHVRIDRWVTDRPVARAPFLIGRFREVQLRPDGPRPVTGVEFTGSPGRFVMQQDLPDGTTQQALVEPPVDERVIEDMAEAADHYSRRFGALPYAPLWLAAAARGTGESWPGVVNASWGAHIVTPATWEEEFERARLVARQWWGGAVVPRTPRDRWLTEGLAAWSALHYLEARHPGAGAARELLDRWSGELVFEHDDRARGRAPAAPIGLGNRSSSMEPGPAYDRIIALKGAWVVRMLEARVTGDDARDDRRFVRIASELYAGGDGRVGVADLRRLVEHETGEDLGGFLQQWIYGSEIPEVRCAWRDVTLPGGAHAVDCRVEVSGVTAEFAAPLDVRVDLGDGRSSHEWIKLTGPKTTARLPALPAAPRKVEFNGAQTLLGAFERAKWRD